MTTFRDKLFVIGGNHFRGSTDYDDVLGEFLHLLLQRRLFLENWKNYHYLKKMILDCEYYQPKLDCWTRVAPMLTGQSDVGIAVYNGRIYVTGGYSWNNR